MMNKYRDIFESTCKFAEAKADDDFLGTLVFSWGKSDVFNLNHRYYPHKTFESAVNALNTRVGKVHVPGQVDHPLGGGSTRLGDVSHILTKVWMDKDKVAWAEAKLLKTQRAKDTLRIIKSGVAIGASLRGFGEIDSSGKVKPGLEVKSVDLVCDPSFGSDATITQANVIESYISDGKYEFNEDDLTAVTNAMDELSDQSIAMIQEKLAKSDHIEMTKEQVKALPIWIRLGKSNPDIKSFHEWFEEQQQLFGQNNPQDQYAINEELYRQSISKNEGRIAGTFRSANTMYGSRARIEARQKEIDKALSGKTMTEQTVSRLFAEYCLAGGKLSRAAWIEEFGF